MDGSRGKGKKLSGKAESYMVSLIGGIQKIIQMSLYSKQKQTHRHRKQTYSYQRGKVGRDKLRLWY